MKRSTKTVLPATQPTIKQGVSGILHRPISRYFKTIFAGMVLFLLSVSAINCYAIVIGGRAGTLAAGTVPAAGSTTICISAPQQVIYSFKFTESATANSLNTFRFVTSGTYVAADVTTFQLYWNIANTIVGATSFGTVAGAGPGTQTIAGAPNKNLTSGPWFFFVVANIAPGATVGHTITVTQITNTTATSLPNFTFTTAGETYSGTAAAPITQSIASSPTLSAASAVCPGATTTLTGTPSGGTFVSGTPANATVSAGGIVTGVNAAGGTSVITYTQGGCPASVTETVNIGPTPVIVSPASSFTVCPGSSTTVTAAANIPTPAVLLSQNFNSGMTGTIGGTWNIVNTGASSPYNWNIVSGTGDPFTFDFSNGAYITGDGTPYLEADPDAVYGATLSTTLYSPTFSTVGYTSGTLTYNYYIYSFLFYYDGDFTAEVDYSVNGGSTWTVLKNYLGGYGQGTTTGTWAAATPNQSISLPAGALNQSNVMIRFNYSSDFGDWWALDNIVLQCSPNTLPASAFTWAGPSGLSCSSGCYSSALSPTAGGVNVYTASATYLTCTRSTPVTVNVVVPPLITSNAPVCIGSNLTLTDANTTGTWSSGNTALATVNSTTGVVTGIASGNPNITYTVPPGCPTTVQTTVNPLPNVSIFSTPSATNACPGTTSTITVNSSTLGTASYLVSYALSGANTATATTTLNMVSGVGTFNTIAMSSAGLTTLVITSVTNATNCSNSPLAGDTVAFIVNLAPSAISGATSVCAGASAALTDVGGGTWSSGNTAVATVDASGNVNGVSGGVANIIYTLSTGCTTTSAVTVNSVPPISGISAVCFGQTATLSDASTAGAWSSTNTAIATIGATTGILTGGTSVGVTTVSFTLASSGCAATLAFGVTNTPGVFTVTGGGSYCAGGAGMHIGLTGSNPDVSYQLYVGGSTSVGSAILGTGGVLDFGAQTIAGTYTVIANPGTACATTMAGNAVISTTSLPPDVYTVSGGGAFCAGGIGFHILLSNSDFGYNYQLFNGGVPVGTPLAGVAGLLTFPLQTASGVYTVVAINAATGCSRQMSGSATITNFPLPNVYIVTGGGQFCNSPGSTGVGIGLSNSDAGTTYRLFRTGGVLAGTLTGTGSILSLGLQTISGTYTVVATSAAGCVNTMSGSATVVANPLPTVANVTGGGAYCAGGTGVVVGLNGSQIGISYQLFDTTAAAGSPITGTSFALNFGLQTNAGMYTVLGTNITTGCQNTMTGSVTVTINPTPNNTYFVTGGGSYCTGGTGVVLGLSGSDLGVRYQLYNGATPTGIIMAGTGLPLSFGSITTAGTYYVVGTITATGCTATMTGNTTVVINTPPRAFTVLGGGNYCIGGSGEPIVLNGSTNGIQYQLNIGTTPIIGDTLIGTGYALTFGPLTSAGSYNIVATNEATTCTSNMTGSATIVINPLPTVYTVTGGGGICPGGSGVHVGLSGSDMGVNYQLSIGGSPGGTFPGTGGPLDFGLQTTFANYSVTATNTVTGCVNAMAGFASVSSSIPPSVYTITPIGSSSYCAGGTGVLLGLGNSTAAVNYQLYRGGSPVGSPVPGAGFGISFGNQTAAGTYTVIATDPVTTCTSAMSGTATISINPLPTVFTVTGGGGYCTGGTGVPVGLSGSATGITYQLIPAGASTSGTGSAISFGNETVAGTYTILATNPTTSCTVNMFSSAAVVINTPPTAYTLSGGGSYCAGGIGRLVGMTSSNTGVNYQLYNGSSPVGTPAAGTGSAFNFGLETAPGTYTVIATNLSTTCANNMTGSETITVNPLPTADTITGGGGYCLGGTGVNVGLSNSSTSDNYQLLNGSVLVGGLTPGTGTALNFGLQLAAGTYTVLATDGTTTCTNSMYGNATVVINPLPNIYYISGGGNHCPGGVGNHVFLNGSDAGISYQLQIGGVPTGSAMAGTGVFLDFGPQTASGVYSVVAVNTVTGCMQTMSGVTTVGVSPLPDVDTVTGGGNYCPGGTGVAVTLNGSSTGVNYQLFLGGVAKGGAVAGTGSALALGSETELGVYTIQATDTTTGCSDMMYGNTTVGNYPLPAAFVVSGGGSFCPGGAGVPVIMGGSEAGVLYQLMDGGVMEGGPVAGTGSGLNFGPQTATGIYTVVATNTGTTCSSNMTGSATVANYPLPTLYSVTGGGNYCTGGTGVNVSLAGSDFGTTYLLYNVGSVGGAISGTGSGINFGLQTASGSYTVIATNSTTGCTNNMAGAAIVSVRPLPTVYMVSASSSSYCAGTDGVDVFMTMSDPGINYQLYRGGSMVGVPVLGSGSALSFGAQTAAGIYTVVAIDATAGCMSNMSGSASISVKPVPTAYNVIGGGGYCAGGSGEHIGISGSAAGISYQLWSGGSPVGPAISGTGAAIDLGAQTVAGSYTVIGTNLVSGCANDMSGAAAITINPLPGIYTVTGGGSYCSGGTGVAIGLSGSDVVDVSYRLSRGGTPVGVSLPATGASLNFGTQTTAGTYIVTATNTVTSCTINMASSALISINSLPTVYTMTGGGSYCNGGTGVAVGLSGSNSGVGYQLYRGAAMVGASVTGTGAAIGFGIQTLAGAYTVIATNDATSCTNSMTGAATISINPLPVVYNVIGGGNYCPGGSGVHIGLDGSTAGILYQLFLGGAPVTGGTVTGTGSPIDFGLQTGLGAYTVKATNPGTGCASNMAGSTSAALSTPVTPTVSVSTGSGDTVCAGTSTTFSATTTNAGSTPVYLWSVNGVAASHSSVFTYVPSDGDNVGLTVTSSAECASPASVSSSLVISVLAHELPSVSVTTSPGTDVCLGTTVNFVASPAYGGTTPSYIWVTNGVTAASGPTYSYTPAQGDVIYVQMSSNYPCRLANVVSGSNIVMTVDSPLIPVVTIIASPSAHVYPGDPITLTASVVNGGPDPTFQWYINGTGIAGAVSNTYTANSYSNLDSVSLQVTSSGPCSGLVGFNSLIIYTNESVTQITNNGSDVMLIPNPNNGAFTIKGTLGTTTDEEVSVEVFDMLGQAIYKSHVMTHNGDLNEQVQLSGSLANGMYMLNLRSASRNNVFHFVIEQ